MRLRAIARTVVFALFVIAGFASQSARAQLADGWRYGSGSNGLVTTSVFSTSTLSVESSRVIEYHPVLIIGCLPGGGWTQSIQLRDSVSGRQTIDLSLRLDGRTFSEQWTLGFQNRSFSMDGDAAVARLLNARRLTVVWRFGFLDGTGDADFNLTGIQDALAKIAGSCGIPLP